MKTAKISILAISWTASLLGVGLWAQAGTGTDATQPQPAAPIITGENIGFRPAATAPDGDGRIAGCWMVKINGQWVEATSAMRIVR